MDTFDPWEILMQIADIGKEYPDSDEAKEHVDALMLSFTEEQLDYMDDFRKRYVSTYHTGDGTVVISLLDGRHQAGRDALDYEEEAWMYLR